MLNVNQNIVSKWLPFTFIDPSNEEQSQITNALTSELAIALEDMQAKVDSYQSNYLEATTCLPNWLDAIANMLGWGNLWDSKWQTSVKRDLLINNDWLWSNRGTLRAINKLFEIFELDAEIAPISGFKAGETPASGQVGFDPFSYEIRANPDILQQGTKAKLELDWVINNFIPCWIYLQIQQK